MTIRFNKRIIYYLLLLLPIFQPKIFTQFEITKMLYIFLNICEFIYLFLKNKKIDYMIFMWLLFRVYLLILIIINYDLNSLLQWGNITIMVTNLIFLIEQAKKHDDIEHLLKGMLLISNVFLLINLVTILVYPRGIITVNFWNSTDNDIYFLGIKTQMPLIMFPAVTSAILLYKQSKNNFKKLLLTIVLCLANALYKNITTALIGFILGGIIYIMPEKIKKQFTLKRIFLIALIIQVSIIFLNVQSIFSTLLINYFHKDITMSSRIYIWKNAWDYIMNMDIINIIFGTGSSLPFVPFGKSYINPHSQLLQFIYTNGIIGNILLLSFFNSLSKKEKTNKNYIILSICFVELILCTVEAYFDNAICFIPFLLLIINHDSRIGCDANE